MSIEIKQRYTREVLHLIDAESLRHLRLTKANLAGANLAGADLTGANLAGADLTGANLTGANLRLADLTGANLAGADLAGADLTGADLAGADLYVWQLYKYPWYLTSTHVYAGCIAIELKDIESLKDQLPDYLTDTQKERAITVCKFMMNTLAEQIAEKKSV